MGKEEILMTQNKAPVAAFEAQAGGVAAARSRGFFFMHRRSIRRLAGILFLGLLAAGFVLRAAEVWRPIDYTSNSPWRECDLGMIARNFWRGDMNILYPQIDWRGDGPGYVESELPVLAWLMALGYRIFGYHEEIGRVLALLISLASVWAFFALARALLPPFQARVATVFFLFNPIMVEMATNIQPDPGMLLGCILCVHALLRWLRFRRPADLAACALCGALAILLKAPALCLGLLIAPLCFEKFGPRALRHPALWLLGAVMLLPGVLWYAHARRFWLVYGNSLGLSNETHWIGADLLAHPRELARLGGNMLRIEALQVFGLFGLLPAALALRRVWATRRPVVYWLGAVFVFYIVALRTTGDNWAFYYHALAVAPACLLLGLAVSPRLLVRARRGAGFPPAFPRARNRIASLARSFLRYRLVPLAALLALGYLGLKSVHSVDFLPSHRGDAVLRPRFAAAGQFAPLIKPAEKVVTVGGFAFDETGRSVAYDDGSLIFFLDRQGFIVPREEARVDSIRPLARRGAQYLVEKRDSALATEARTKFRSVAIAGDYELFAIPKE